ncbi:hypothetical protein N7470_007314 [Penicillium chermesinum]|nr:hypothetical protein N7470_007314 [Penicillium chermesinum]
MAFGDNLVAVGGISLLEAYLLQRTVFADETFYTLCWWAFGSNFAVLTLYSAIIWPFFLNPLRHLPTVPGLMNNSKIIFDSPRGRLPLIWMKTIPNDGLIHLRDRISYSLLIPTNHQALLDIMSTNTYDFEKPRRARDFLARILGFGLILSEGAAHKKQRKALTPAFNIKNIRAMYTLMWDKTNQCLEEMEKELKANPMEGTNPADGVGKLEMGPSDPRYHRPCRHGTGLPLLQNSENKVAESFLRILEPTKEKMAFLALNFVFPQWFTQRIPWRLNKVVAEETGFLRSLCNDIVREKREALESSKASAQDLEADILGTMMLGGDFSDTELVDQMLTFLAAGRPDLDLLPSHSIPRRPAAPPRRDPPAYPQRRGPNHTRRPRIPPSFKRRLPRGSTPVPDRPCHSPRIDPRHHGGRQTRTQGTRLIICPYAINRAPIFWGDNGEEFIPERWIDTDKNGNLVPNNHGGASTNFAQITFLHGQRSCIGKDFARAELRCAVAGVVGRFAFEMQDPTQEIHIAGAVTTKPVEGMNLAMRRVEGW